MKKILFSLMAILLAVGLVGAGAFAYFSDTETSEGNTFTAGTLDLAPGSDFVQGETGYYPPYTHCTIEVIPGGNGANGQVIFSDIKPGNSGKIYWSVKNIGTIPGLLNMEVTRTADNDNVITEPEDMVDGSLDGSDGTDDGDLDDYMYVRLSADFNKNGDFTDAGEIVLDRTVMGELETYFPLDILVTVLENHALAVNDYLELEFAWRIDPDIPGVDDNIIQGDSVQLDIIFTLNQ